MKNAILTALAAALTLTATAAERSIEEMRTIAAAQLQTRTTTNGSRRAQAATATPRLIRATDAYAVFEPAQGGAFVIVGRDDSSRPVLGYADAAFPSEDMPDGLEWYLQQLEAAAPRRAEATFTPVENFITTKWSQEHPFNNKTPQNFPAGCVATAMAQCLNYCQWPASAAFEGECSVTTKTGRKEKTERKTLDISSTYTWPYKDTYSTIGRVTDNIDELLRDCGYAVYMSYSADGSGAALGYAGIALTHTFGYPQESVRYIERSYVPSQDEWAQTIYDELALRSPIIFGASDESFGGHAFVLSGVNEEGLVYINWGWRGTADGFYAITDLNPVQGGDEMHFNNSQHIITGIRKEPVATDHIQPYIIGYSGDPYTFRWGVETDDDGMPHQTLYVDLPYGFINYSPADFIGVFGLYADDLTDGSTWVIAPDLQDRDTIPSGYGYAGSDERYRQFYFYYFIDGAAGLKPDHTYRMAFGTCDDREGTWRSIICDDGEVAYEVTYTGNPETSTVSEERTTPPVLTAIDRIVTGSSTGRGDITRVFDAQGRLVMTAPTSRFNPWDIPGHGIFVITDASATRKVVR